MEVVEWGTWEELILVSAVLRYGTDEWEAVVGELRVRTFVPGRFTVEVCKEKYEDLQQHFSTCSDLLEGLRKKRIAELKRTLEKSDDSIGFLQSKLQNLKFEKGHSSSVDYQSSPFESPVQTSVGQSLGKDTSKDGLSAGSYTQEISNVQYSPIYAPVAQTLQQTPTSIKLDKIMITEDLVKNIQMEWGIGVKKKRGKRKRRGYSQQVKEENFDELAFKSVNMNLHLLSRIKVEPTSECDLASQPYVVSQCSNGADALKCSELTRIFEMVANNEYASIFQRRLDSQKRARYRMMVKQHMDLDAIKFKIDKQAITSTTELLRDLLLLATNAETFYSRNTREHKHSVILRGLVKKLMLEHKKSSIAVEAPAVFPTSPVSVNALHISPFDTTRKKPKTASPDNHISMENLKADESISKAVQGAKKTSKEKHSHAMKTISHTAKDISRKQPHTKSRSKNTHNTKYVSMHQPQVKLAFVNARNNKDGYMNDPQEKTATVNDSRERKRARKL